MRHFVARGDRFTEGVGDLCPAHRWLARRDAVPPRFAAGRWGGDWTSSQRWPAGW